MERYLVTGAAGFIGWKVCEFLLLEGHTVVGVDNLNDAYDVRLKHWRLDQVRSNPNFCFHHLDICDREGLRQLFVQYAPTASASAPFAAVVNLAARAGVRQSVENPWVYFETNVIGTLNLLELCRQFEVSKFVAASSSSVYGKDNPMPYREDADTNHPMSPYAASKKSTEALCYSYHALHGIDISLLRYFTVYGPAGRPDMMPFRMVRWMVENCPITVYGDGRQSRDFTYVDDIARGTIAALRPLGYEIINLGSDRPVILLDALRLVEELTGQTAVLEFKPAHSADVPATWADIKKAHELLAWQPQTSIEQGLAELIAWYQNNRSWASEISLA